jgi:hypothetical protein
VIVQYVELISELKTERGRPYDINGDPTEIEERKMLL